jgi:hypothetical protein
MCKSKSLCKQRRVKIKNKNKYYPHLIQKRLYTHWTNHSSLEHSGGGSGILFMLIKTKNPQQPSFRFTFGGSLDCRESEIEAERLPNELRPIAGAFSGVSGTTPSPAEELREMVGLSLLATCLRSVRARIMAALTWERSDMRCCAEPSTERGMRSRLSSNSEASFLKEAEGRERQKKRRSEAGAERGTKGGRDCKATILEARTNSIRILSKLMLSLTNVGLISSIIKSHLRINTIFGTAHSSSGTASSARW